MSSEPAAKGPRRSIRIGKYEVVAHIATGGMGAVYKARNTETGEDVALKVLSPELAANPAMVERFRREAKHASKLNHENIVALHEFSEASHTYFLVMEFVEGIDLHEYLTQKGALDPREALEIILQACQALDHAYERGVIHRDIKPSNFLLTRQSDRMVVKLTDLGLAREASNKEFRVTKAGTTIGTLDYMSPEQARDSAMADIRSDLYSLGCTWYHLLAGNPPFPKGGLGERLHRILHEESADVRQFNPRVSTTMAAVVHRLMAKRPAQRYQTPADLLRDLEALQRGETLLTPRQALESLAEQEGIPPPPPRSKSRPVRPAPRTASFSTSSSRSDTQTSKSTDEVPIPDAEESTRPYLVYGIIVATAIIVIAAVVVALSLRRSHRDGPRVELSSNPVVQESKLPQPTIRGTAVLSLPPNPQKNPEAEKKPDGDTRNTAPPSKLSWPTLYRPIEPINVAALRQEIDAPWKAATAASGPTVELTVGRLTPAPSGKTFRSLASACLSIPTGATGVIELRDNGPFFDVPAAVADRGLVIRAAKGYSPILVWDVQRTLDERRHSTERREAANENAPLIFLEVRRGNLKLEGIHIAFKWPDAPSSGAAVLSVEDGDLSIQDCTLSVAGKPRDGIMLARFTAAPRPVLSPGAGENSEGRRCRFERCYARGAKVSILDLNAPGAQVLFENCLLVGEDMPLLQVRAVNDRLTRMHAVRSTIICGQTLMELRLAQSRDRKPAFEWLGWDTLVSRKKPERGGELLRLCDDINTGHISWRAINCLYAGWGNLLVGTKSIAGADILGWQRLWGRYDGDALQAEAWPRAVFPELAEMPARTYTTAGSFVAFAASTSSARLLGCDLDSLPPVRDNWLSLAFDRLAIQVPNVADDADPPNIPTSHDGLFHGARLDLNRIDLGLYLQSVQRSYRLAPEVVLRLSGSGECLMTPLHLKGSSLVLYFEPPPEKKTPLVLVPAGRGAAEAPLVVEQGDLTLIDGNLRFSEAPGARVVPWLIKVRGGDLRLLRTHLEVPPKDSGATFRGLISLQGSNDLAAERVRACIAHESVLVSARDALAIEGIGVRVLLAQSLLIAGENAIRLTLDPASSQRASGPFTDKANVHCLFDHATVAARGGVVHLSDVQLAGPPTEPVIVQSHDCGFVNLFAGRASRPSLVRYEDEALAHGLLLWQSENDGFDHRLWFGATCTAMPLPEKPDEHTSWMALWRSPALRGARLDLANYRTLDATRWPLEQKLAGWRFPGANLEKLHLARMTAPKIPR
jgi:serine/threonine-protein kinase